MNIKFIPLFLLLTASCTMFDDRGDCPSWLTLDVTAYKDSTNAVNVYIHNYDKLLVGEKADIPEDRQFTYRLQRVKHSCSVVYGFNDENVDAGIYTIPLGSEMTNVYGSIKKEIIPYDEMPPVIMPVNKQYALLRLEIEEDIMERYSNMIAIFSSSTAGMNLMSFEGVKGTFLYTPKLSYDGTTQVKLPRQKYNDLSLAITENGAIVQSYNLSSILKSSGYDWEAISLQDILLKVSLRSPEASITVTFGMWEEGGEYGQFL